MALPGVAFLLNYAPILGTATLVGRSDLTCWIATFEIPRAGNHFGPRDDMLVISRRTR